MQHELSQFITSRLKHAEIAQLIYLTRYIQLIGLGSKREGAFPKYALNDVISLTCCKTIYYVEQILNPAHLNF